MGLTPPIPDPPDPDAQFQAFEDAWRRGDRPSLDAFAGSPPDRDTLLALVQIDLEYRWAAGGDRPLLERYLADLPALGPADARLVGAEYRARRWAGDRPTAAEYAGRFGLPVDELADLIASVDDELAHEFPSLGTAVPAGDDPAAVAFRAAAARLGLLDPAADDGSPAPVLARRLIGRGRLTRFQADRLLSGRGGELVVGPYVLEAKIGEGATGRVYLARHQPGGGRVALKVFRRDLLDDADESALARFRREAEAAARLAHPHVVRSLAAGTAGGRHYLAMEYLDGTDLARLVARGGPLPVTDATESVRQAALGLQHLHEQGLVHRDVKPSNLMACPGAGVKLLDVGMARVLLPDGDPSAPLTRPGDFLGTPDYLAPEQALDPHAADARSDLYSLGCTWYFLLTGRPPFPGGGFVRTVDRHRREPPEPVGRLRPDVPPAVAEAVHRLLAKRPADRFPSAAALADRLGELRGQRSGPSRRRPLAGLGATIGLTVLAVAVGLNPMEVGPTAPEPAVGPATVHVAADGAWQDSGLDATGGEPLTMSPGGRWAADGRECAADGLTDAPPDRAVVPGVRVMGLLARIGGAGEPFAIPAETTVTPVVGGRVYFRANDLADGGRTGRLAVAVRGGRPATGPAPPVRPTEAEAAEQEYRNLLLQAADWKDEPAQTAAAVRDFRRRYPGTVQAERAAVLLMGLPCALDRLPPVAPNPGDADPVPDGLVAVLGERRPKHWWAVTALALDPTGRVLASGGSDGTARLWDAATGTAVRVVGPMSDAVYGLAFDRTGRVLAARSQGGQVRLWNAADGRPLRTLRRPGRPGAASAIALSPDGRTLALGGGSPAERVVLLDAATGQETASLLGPGPRTTALVFAPDGRHLAAVGIDGVVRVWESGARAVAREFPAEPVERSALAFRADGRALAVAVGDVLTVWDVTDGRRLMATTGAGQFKAVAFSPDGRTLAYAGDRDCLVRVCDAETGRESRPLAGHGDIVTGLAFDPAGGLVSSSRDGTIKWWDVAAGRERADVPRQPADLGWVGFREDGEVLYTGSKAGEVKFWDAGRGKELRSVFALPGVARSVAVSWDGAVLACGGWDGRVKLWETATGRMLHDLRAHPSWVHRLAFSPDGRTLASTGLWDPPGVRLWDVAGGRPLRTLPVPGANPQRYVSDMVFGPAGRTLVTLATNGGLLAWDVATGRPTSELPTGESRTFLNSFALAPSGRVGALGADGTITIWNPATGEAVRSFRGHDGFVVGVTFRPDGRRLASVGMDGLVKVWNADTGGLVQVVRVAPAAGRVHEITFSPDGRHLATANGNGTAYILRLRSETAGR